jgi:hypothetical protein
MKSLIITTAFGLFLAVLIAHASGKPKQTEHAPTVAQCQVDQKLWLPKVQSDSPLALTHITVPTLTDWMAEMRARADVDQPNKESYYHTGSDTTARIDVRLVHNLSRHDLWSEFLAEDAAGKR